MLRPDAQAEKRCSQRLSDHLGMLVAPAMLEGTTEVIPFRLAVVLISVVLVEGRYFRTDNQQCPGHDQTRSEVSRQHRARVRRVVHVDIHLPLR